MSRDVDVFWYPATPHMIRAVRYNDEMARYKLWKRSDHDEALCLSCARSSIGDSNATSASRSWRWRPSRALEQFCTRCGFRVRPSPAYKAKVVEERQARRSRARQEPKRPRGPRSAAALDEQAQRLAEAGILRREYIILEEED
jgi:hypothetical protein